MSVVKALEHASMRCGQKLDLQVRNDMTPLYSPLPSVMSPKANMPPNLSHLAQRADTSRFFSISCRIVKGRSDDIVGRLVGSRKGNVDARPSPISQRLEGSMFRQVRQSAIYKSWKLTPGVSSFPVVSD